MKTAIAAILCACLFVGCIKKLADDTPRYGAVVGDCVVPLPAGLKSWGAPVSLEYTGKSLWIWPGVTRSDDSEVRHSAAWVDDPEAVCTGGVSLLEDGGQLRSLLKLNAEESADNASRTDGRRWLLSATGGFVHQGRGYLYYEKILQGPGVMEASSVGMGLCILESGGKECVRGRPQVIPGAPTLLWDRASRLWNRGALVADDGYAYLYGCQGASTFRDFCYVARVLPDQAADPGAYKSRAAFDSWGDNSWGAEKLFENSGAVTVARNDHLGKYEAVCGNIWDATLEVRLGDKPWGAFKHPHLLVEAIKPESWFIDGGRQHSALQNGGRRLVLTYYTNAEGGARGLHLITFRIDWEG